MAITEHSRHHMITALEGAIGEEAAMTLAEHLPPVGWADVATRQDLDQLEERIAARFDAVDSRFEILETQIAALFNRVGSRFEIVDSRFEILDGNFEVLEYKLSARIADLATDLHKDLTRLTVAVIVALISAFAAFAALVIAVVQTMKP